MNEGMSAIVKTMSVLLIMPMTIFGMYVIIHGHLTPGGGFPGGAVMATMMAMLFVAFGAEKSKKFLGKGSLSTIESLGLLAFAAVAFIGIQATFFSNFLANSASYFGMSISYGPNPGYLNSGGVLPLMNLAVGIEVFAAITAIVLVMLTYREEKS
ncbi:MAG: sodium:proton antiporter [Candidatus Aenigmarchaeota archaeon]|nr:sodium:proton antiporter [Candidatus Aenigmarchaeota archaeon]